MVLLIAMFPCLVKKSDSFLKLIKMKTIHYNQHNQETNLPLSRLFIFFSVFRAGRLFKALKMTFRG